MKKYSCKEYSQNHRMFEMGREVIWFNTLHQTGHLEPVAQDHVQMAFKYLQGWTLHLSGQLVPVSDHPHSKKSVSWSSEGISCVSFVPITSSSITMLYLQSLTLFLALSLQVFITFSLRLFISRLKNPSAQSFLHKRCSGSLYHHLGPSLDLLQ